MDEPHRIWISTAPVDIPRAPLSVEAIQEGCGTTKTCYLEPVGCQGSACRNTVAYQPRGKYMDFEVASTLPAALGHNIYTSVGFNDEPQMVSNDKYWASRGKMKMLLVHQKYWYIEKNEISSLLLRRYIPGELVEHVNIYRYCLTNNEDKMVYWRSYLYNGNPHTKKDLFILKRSPGRYCGCWFPCFLCHLDIRGPFY